MRRDKNNTRIASLTEISDCPSDARATMVATPGKQPLDHPTLPWRKPAPVPPQHPLVARLMEHSPTMVFAPGTPSKTRIPPLPANATESCRTAVFAPAHAAALSPTVAVDRQKPRAEAAPEPRTLLRSPSRSGRSPAHQVPVSRPTRRPGDKSLFGLLGEGQEVRLASPGPLEPAKVLRHPTWARLAATGIGLTLGLGLDVLVLQLLL